VSLSKPERDAHLRSICVSMDQAIANAERAIASARTARIKAMELMGLESVKSEPPGGINTWARGEQ
jgi:hypothetical protein